MRRLRLQFIISIILLFLPAAMVLAGFNRPGVSTLALLWLVIGGYWLIRFFLNPMEKLWKTMRALDPELQFASYQKFLKKTYRHLNEQEQRIAREKKGREEMESLLFSMVEGVVATDSSGRISFLNPAAEKIFQIDHGSALGKYPREVRRELELLEMYHQVFVTGEPQSREFQMDTPQNPI